MLRGHSANQPDLHYRVYHLAVKAALERPIILLPVLLGNTCRRTRRDFMDGEIGARQLIFLAHANAHKGFQATIDNEPTHKRKTAPGQRADQLRGKTYPAEATKCLRPEDASGKTSPCSGQPVQRPPACKRLI